MEDDASRKEDDDEKEMVPPWSELPQDIWISIAKILSPNHADYVHFGAVCKSWQSVASIENYLPAHRMPLLLLDEDDAKPNPTGVRRFFSASEDKIYEFPLPEACGKMCCTSTGGYILTIGKELEMHLLDPWTRDQIWLPSLNEFVVSSLEGGGWPTEQKRKLFIGKVCLSSSSPLKRDKECTALAFYGDGRKLAYAKLGKRDPQTRWTSIWCKWWPYKDAVFYKGRFHVVNSRGDVVALDLEKRKADMVAPRPYDVRKCTSETYLVELYGDLLQVIRFRVGCKNDKVDSVGLGYKTSDFWVFKTSDFWVYKMVEGGKWEVVKSFGGRSLFVGLNNTFSVEARGLTGCKENCIYFTEDYRLGILDGGYDMGVYNMEDRSIKPHFTGELFSKYSPPLWIAPFMWYRGGNEP